MVHLINRLQFEFNCPDEEQAFNFRQNFTVTFQEQIANVTDTVCAKYVSEKEWLRIDKIEIDLGYFSPDSFDANFAEIFKYKFEKELTQKLSGISHAEKKVSLQLSKRELFQYFLLKGVLPWWAGETEINIDEIAIDVITHQPEAIKRFFYKFQDRKNMWLRVAFQLKKESKTLITSLIEELKITKDLFFNWVQQLKTLLQNEPETELKITDEAIEDFVFKNATEIFQNIRDKNTLFKIFEDNIKVIFEDKKSIINRIVVDDKVNEDVSTANNEQTQTTQTDFLLKDEISHYKPDKENVTDKYIVKHAGIILLAPFIKPFFTNLHLLNDIEWKNKNAQYKAVHLLKFLSTGEQQTPEYNLTLEKIICGLNIEVPIPLDILLEADETNEATTLLESVIQHWKALKNTSVNGLRESFLKRDGLLTQKENGWLLQVERKTLDVLIDSIPWGYSTVAFPWNTNLIFVEW